MFHATLWGVGVVHMSDLGKEAHAGLIFLGENNIERVGLILAKARIPLAIFGPILWP